MASLAYMRFGVCVCVTVCIYVYVCVLHEKSLRIKNQKGEKTEKFYLNNSIFIISSRISLFN